MRFARVPCVYATAVCAETASYDDDGSHVRSPPFDTIFMQQSPPPQQQQQQQRGR